MEKIAGSTFGAQQAAAAKISSKADYDKLPRGAQYIDPNGVPRIKQ